MELFKNGSVWLRADFHLHTKADKEAFLNWQESLSFKKEYIKRLTEEDIRVGIITNHNKFDRDEFKALAGEAGKHEIFLLPGVELSVGEGNGIHVLIAFDPVSWISQHENFIERFLNEAFPHFTGQDRENRNARTRWNLMQTLEKLQEHREHGNDSFVIMAHVDQDNGFCKELNYGRQKELIAQPLFKKLVIGFQKCVSKDRKRGLIDCYSPQRPAFVEGSDGKNMEDIGKCREENSRKQKCFIKIGDYNFSAVKYALIDGKRNFVGAESPKPANAFLQSITFKTGTEAPLESKTIYLNSNMNNLIGIRGSGKSTILETIRYALNVKFDPSAKDTDYKNRLVEMALRSGGKVILHFKDRFSNLYRVERVLGERAAIYRENDRLPQFSIDENLMRILYFGQKDLAEVGSTGFSLSLMEKFFGAKLAPVREKIEPKKQQVLSILDKVKNLTEISERRKEFEEKRDALKEGLRIFKEKRVDEKLNKQVQFNKDSLQLSRMIEAGQEFEDDLNRIYEDALDVFQEYAKYSSPENQDLFGEINSAWVGIVEKLQSVGKIRDGLRYDLTELKQAFSVLDERIKQLQDEFAEIKRTINIPNLNADDFVKFNKQLSLISAKLQEVSKQEAKRETLQKLLSKHLHELKNLWHEEFQILQQAVDELNAKGLSISIELKYKGDKKNMQEYLSSIIKGSGVTSKNIESICDQYKDFVEIFFEFGEPDIKLKSIISEVQYYKFKDSFYTNLRDLLTYKPPNKYILKYKGKNIVDHSLGQRASALIVFLLARRENDLIIIDQPEDDIDNQSIYEDVINEIIQLKEKVQFIFATHNPNIPVLGECEQVICCRYVGTEINLETGSIDKKKIQKNIVEIMEGGKKAFEKRIRKYKEWKYSNY